MRLAVGPVLGIVLLAALGCANPFIDFNGKQSALEEAQGRYTELVRWGEIESASIYVDPTITADFLATAARFEDIRITQFESGPPQFGEGSETATVNVVYHAYSTKTLVEKKFYEKQEWYRDESAGNDWRVRPDLAGIAKKLSGSR
jgi:hypothetical protein